MTYFRRIRRWCIRRDRSEYLLRVEFLAFWIADVSNRCVILDLVLVPRMFEHPDIVTPYDVGPISFESDGKLGVLVSLCERLGQSIVFLPLRPIFLFRIDG